MLGSQRNRVRAALVLLLGMGILPVVWTLVQPREDALPLEDTLVLAEPANRVAISLPVRDGAELDFHAVVVTGYSSSREETDSTPFLTASMTQVRTGCLALSRDLLRTFTPEAPFDFGDWVVLPGTGVFIVEDTMHPRWKNRADIWFPDRRQAIRWGRQKSLIARLPSPPEEGDGLFALGPLAPTAL